MEPLVISPESLEVDPTWVVWEPTHGGLPWPARVSIALLGDRIVDVKTEAGFVSRGIEDRLRRSSWLEGGLVSGLLDPEVSFYYERCYIESIEKLMTRPLDEPTAKKQEILSREMIWGWVSVYFLLGCLSRLGRASQISTLFHFGMREKERVHDFLELLVGQRYPQTILRAGQKTTYFTEGILVKMKTLVEGLILRAKEYQEIFFENPLVLREWKNSGVISAEDCDRFGITGTVLRAAHSDLGFHGREEWVHLNQIKQESIKRGVCLGSVSARALQWCLELQVHLTEISFFAREWALRGRSSLAVKEPRVDLKMNPGEVVTQLETPRGRLECRISSNGQHGPQTVRWVTPSKPIFKAIQKCLVSESYGDVPLILESLGMSTMEVDL